MKDEKDILSNNGDIDKDNLRNEDIFNHLNESTEIEDADEDLLALLDMISAQDEKKNGNESADNSKESGKRTIHSDQTDDIFSIDDFNLDDNLSDNNDLYGNDSGSDSFQPDKAVNVGNEEVSNRFKNLGNMGDVFSDALSAMDRLEDEDRFASSNTVSEKNPGFFKRLFTRKNKKPAIKSEDNKENKKALKAASQEGSKKNNTKEEKKDTKAAVKKAKVSKEKKAKKVPEEKILTEEEKFQLAEEKEAKAKKAAEKAKKAAEKAEKKKVADAKKAEKSKAAADKAADKKQKKLAKKELTPPDPEDSIKLNMLGIVFIMTFFILIAGVVIIGTDTYSYNLEVKNANINFSRGRYMEAYDDIYGLNIKKKDTKTYDKIMTSMYVYKQLNSYYNYTEMNKYPEALDSLLKGLDRYNVHIAHAKELGIEKNLKSMKKEILAELKASYGLTEKQAKAINAIEDHAKYSVKVINIASEKKLEAAK